MTLILSRSLYKNMQIFLIFKQKRTQDIVKFRFYRMQEFSQLIFTIQIWVWEVMILVLDRDLKVFQLMFLKKPLMRWCENTLLGETDNLFHRYITTIQLIKFQQEIEPKQKLYFQTMTWYNQITIFKTLHNHKELKSQNQKRKSRRSLRGS